MLNTLQSGILQQSLESLKVTHLITMASQNFRLQLILSTLGLSISCIVSAISPTHAQVTADLALKGENLSSRSALQVTFEPPGSGTPDDTAGGASRDGRKCTQDANTSSPSITPLMPATNQGLTVAERPTFFVYVPQTSARKAFFSLKDEKEEYYYQTTLSLPKAPRVVSIQLPADAPALEVGKSYQWSLVTICGEQLAVDDPRVQGQVQRIAMNSADKSQLENLPLLEQAALYGADGIWYDTIASLAELRRLQPEDLGLAAAWENLLRSAGLEVVATKSLAK